MILQSLRTKCQIPLGFMLTQDRFDIGSIENDIVGRRKLGLGFGSRTKWVGPVTLDGRSTSTSSSTAYAVPGDGCVVGRRRRVVDVDHILVLEYHKYVIEGQARCCGDIYESCQRDCRYRTLLTVHGHGALGITQVLEDGNLPIFAIRDLSQSA